MRCPHSCEQRSRRSCRTFNVQELIPQLKEACTLPVFLQEVWEMEQVYGQELWRWCDWCFHGITIYSHHGGLFQKTTSKPVSITGRKILCHTKISGSPCTVINTPYVQKIGTQQNAIERILSKNKRLKSM